MDSLVLINGLAGAFAGGIWLAGRTGIAAAGACLAAAILLAGAAAGLYRRRSVAYALLLAAFLCLGGMRMAQDRAAAADDIVHYAGQEVRLDGTIDGAPRVTALDGGKVGVRYVIRATAARLHNRLRRAGGKAILTVRQERGARIGAYGDSVRAAGRVRRLRGYLNPGQIDGAAALARRGITVRLAAREGAVRLRPAAASGWRGWIERSRAGVLADMRRVMPPGDAAVLFAMLFGGYTDVRPELIEAFTATGIIHILSVSGSHITLAAAAAGGAASLLRLPPPLRAGLIAAAVSAYAVFAGLTPPVIRSALMGMLACGALALRRENDARHSLALLALGLLAVQPDLLNDISFQLSFGATAGLLYLAPPIRDRLPSNGLTAGLAVTAAAQLAALPILAWYFGNVSVSAFLANALAVPAAEGAIILGLAAVLLGVVCPPAQPAAWAAGSLAVGWVNEATSFLAKLPGGVWPLPVFSAAAGGLYYLLLVDFVRGFAALKWLRRQLAGAAARRAGIVLLALAALLWRGLETPVLTVHFIDVGQGDAALIITPHGRSILIDTGGADPHSGGGFDVGARVTAPYLRHFGVRRLDCLILTHPHSDHAGGAAAVLRAFMPARVLRGGGDLAEYAAVMRSPPRWGAAPIQARAGQTFTLDGVRAAVIYAGSPAGKGGAGNEASLVVRFTYGDASFLFTGDLPADGEAAILRQGGAIGSTVLKVAHHGSATSTTAAFLRAVHPAWAVISAGADNAFGHPHPDTLRRLQAQRVRVLRTDRNGAVVFSSDGRTIRAKPYVEDPAW